MKHTGKKIALTALSILTLGAQLSYTASALEDEDKDKIDDWEYSFETQKTDVMIQKTSRANTITRPLLRMKAMAETSIMAASPVADSLGFSVGGAKDADNFFQNLEEGYLPRYSSLTYEGLFYDYNFDTGQKQKCDDLFCPSYARGITSDIFSGTTDYYLSVGLNSGLTEENFQRKKLNLIVVLDISGSMGASFNAYYYDHPGNSENRNEEHPESKIEIANQSIVAMLQHLHPEDRFGMVLFDNQGYRAKPLRLVKETNMNAISRHILDLQPRGGTNMAAGIQKGIEQLTRIQAGLKDPSVYENRIIFLTDAMPNRGALSKNGIFNMVKNASARNIFTSFIGIGVDFNPDLVEHITKTRGANYFAVHSSEDFQKRLDEEFDFMVTPLVFNLQLKLLSSDYEIAGVFGSPEADLATGQMMKINTLFPSSTEDEEVRGGVVLVKLRKKGHSNRPIQLSVSYDDRSGRTFHNSNTVRFNQTENQWDNRGIQKAVLLSEYISLLKNWLIDSRKSCNDSVTPVIPCFPYYERGLVNPDFRPEWSELKTWEQQSCPLEVSEGYQKLFSIFSTHFVNEMDTINDPTLQKELDVLNRLKGNNHGQRKDDWKIQ